MKWVGNKTRLYASDISKDLDFKNVTFKCSFQKKKYVKYSIHRSR